MNQLLFEVYKQSMIFFSDSGNLITGKMEEIKGKTRSQ